MLTREQWEGATFLAERSVAMLADGVGYGKTAQLARACDLVRAERVTVICPPILRPNEVHQFRQWSLWGYPSVIVRTAKDDVPADGLVAVSYQLAMVERVRKKLTARNADVLILDEAHRTKTPNSKTTKSIFSKAGIASTARRVWFATGEPTPNNASELFVFAKVCGAWTGTQDDFIRHFCVTADTNFGLKILGTREDRREELKALLRPHMLQRDGIDPERAPLTIDEIAVEGRKPDLSGLPIGTLERIEAAASAGNWQLLDDPSISTVRRLVGVAKAEAVADLAATELDGGVRKMLIFCSHTAVIDFVADRLRPFDVQIIDGRTSASFRQDTIDAFQRPGGCRVIVAHIRAAGEGLTLTAATRVLLAEPAWSPSENTQAIARAWRRGQTQPVRASFVYLPGSVDEAVSKTLMRKANDTLRLRMEHVGA